MSVGYHTNKSDDMRELQVSIPFSIIIHVFSELVSFVMWI